MGAIRLGPAFVPSRERPEEAEDGPLGDRKINAVERTNFRFAGPVHLDQTLGDDCIHEHAPATGCESVRCSL